MFDFRYINRNQQKNSVTYTLIIEDIDNDDTIKEYRMEKVFKCDPNIIDDEFLRLHARKEIDRIYYEINNPIIEVDSGNISE